MKPFTVVRSEVVVVDLGKIAVEPGDHGIVCPNSEDLKTWPLIHWANGYTCNSGLADFAIVSDRRVARITPGIPQACWYCARTRHQSKYELHTYDTRGNEKIK